MATWTTPKTNWTSSDGIGDGDLNRIEENTEYLYDREGVSIVALRDYISQFKVELAAGAAGATEVRVRGGIWCDSASGFVDWGGAVVTKNFTSSNWTSGGGGEAKLTASSYSSDRWFWVFAIYNPTTNTADFAIDDNLAGSNLGEVSLAGYTLHRRICPVKTSSIHGGIVPAVYNSYDNWVRFGGAGAVMGTTIAIGSSSTPVSLQDSGGNPLIPKEWNGTGWEGVELELLISSSVSTTKLNVWNSSEFGGTYVVGIGDESFFNASSDIIKFNVTCPLGSIRVKSTFPTTLNIKIVSFRSHNSGGVYP